MAAHRRDGPVVFSGEDGQLPGGACSGSVPAQSLGKPLLPTDQAASSDAQPAEGWDSSQVAWQPQELRATVRCHAVLPAALPAALALTLFHHSSPHMSYLATLNRG